MSRPFTDPRKRFWALVDIRTPEECWPWRGSKSRGYGQFNLGGHAGKRVGAHRFAYEDIIGKIKQGLDLDHLCRVRSCVNPSHLEPVTRRENLLRGNTIPSRRAAQTECVHGHEFTTENTIYAKDGTRICRSCRDERNRSRYPRKEASE